MDRTSRICLITILVVTIVVVIVLSFVINRASEVFEIKEEITPESMIQEVEETITLPEELSPEEVIDGYIVDICEGYDVEPSLVQSIVWHESRYLPDATNGDCVGLMQISTYWHTDRAKRLGVTDFYDPYSNILLGVDYLNELLIQYKDPILVLMLYNMKHDTAKSMYAQGHISEYASSVLARSDKIKQEVT